MGSGKTRKMAIRSKILSTGSYLPEKVLTNADLEKMVDTSDEWIVQRTGIKQRHIAAEGQYTSDLAIAAAKQALERSGLNGGDIDAVIVATATPDKTFPAVAVKVQAAIGASRGPAFDVEAACSGFIYALGIADNFIKAGQVKRIMLIGAEKISAAVDWTDRTTCVLFADGAGAVILEATEEEEGVISTHLHADGKYSEILNTTGGPSTTGTIGHIYMEGREVFKHAVTFLSEVVQETLEHNDIKPEELDWLIPHQANMRIIESTAKKLNMGMDRVVTTVDHHGNTSAASIPLALDEAVTDGRVKRGQLLLLEALGGGLTWGSALVRF